MANLDVFIMKMADLNNFIGMYFNKMNNLYVISFYNFS